MYINCFDVQRASEVIFNHTYISNYLDARRAFTDYLSYQFIANVLIMLTFKYNLTVSKMHFSIPTFLSLFRSICTLQRPTSELKGPAQRLS